METPSQLKIPSFVMNFPHTLDTKNPNNIWMKELSNDQLKVNKNKAYLQFLDLYNFLAGDALVYLLPHGNKSFQDQVYTANVGAHLNHIKDDNIIVLSNFTSPPRIGEEEVAQPFFKSLGYKTIKSPFKWEGEADLKFIKDNVYIGGYGIRSQYETYEWMEKEFDMNIIKVQMVDEYLYHLDCSIFPLSHDKVMICTELFDKSELKQIEKYAELIDIDSDTAYNGICNSVRFGNTILCASNISELKVKTEDYELEKYKVDTLTNICANEGMEPVLFNLSEFMKSGAMLSCMIMHLNRLDQDKQLI